ncbi:OmpA family protein [Roseivivax sp. GX 12232]|uniref:OmpA family protein n=1 Tax=Roseivivax sp. GX 12232 TaxID=2900547 RepID=UPI001E4D4581|nr:OmpA family protein [Roseivivax sp. GX 12232]MCE0505612.1 OmpA family protein [Roseivivax sp. GX 12232]
MRPIILRRASLALALLGAPAAAQELPLPAGAELTEELSEPGAGYALPTGPWRPEGGLPVRRIEGTFEASAYRLPGGGLTPAQMIAPLRAALEEAGYEVLLDCAAARCGGFDFRFATRVLPAPAMYVDLTDFRFLSGIGPDGGAVSLIVSRSDSAGFLQVIRAGGEAARGGIVTTRAPDPAPRAGAAEPDDPEGLLARLRAEGHVVLEDLDFGSGAAELNGGEVASLEAIAAFLREAPDRRVLFVGHTDAVGSLEANRALSLRRAEAAAAYLRAAGLPEGQVGARGVGFLAPRASNLDEDGRALNRRVEAVLLARE